MMHFILVEDGRSSSGIMLNSKGELVDLLILTEEKLFVESLWSVKHLSEGGIKRAM